MFVRELAGRPRAMRAYVLLVFAAAGSVPAPAAASDVPLEIKRECAIAAETAQRLTARGSLLQSRAELVRCSRDACPPAVRADCLRWLDDLDRSIPSLAIRVEDALGKPLDDARVTIDGSVPSVLPDGRGIALDPGEHVVAVERAGATAHARVALATGEKERVLVVRLPPVPANPAPPAAPLTVASPAPQAEPAPAAAAPGPLAWFLSAASVVALGAFAFFAATGTSDLDRLRASCAGHCAQSDVTTAWNKLIAADVFLGVAVAAGGLAVWQFVAAGGRGHGAPRAPSAGSGFAVVAGHGVAALEWSASF